MRGEIRFDRWLFAASVCLLIIGTLWGARQIGFSTWPSVKAEVLAGQIVREQSHDRPGGPSYATFRPEIRYRYTTPDGQPREATTFAGQWSKNIGEAERFIAEHPAGSRTRIGSDPDHPGLVRFDAGMHISTLWQPLLAIAASLACGLVAWRKRSGRGQAPASQQSASVLRKEAFKWSS